MTAKLREALHVALTAVRTDAALQQRVATTAALVNAVMQVIPVTNQQPVAKS